jgi:capsular polysaccharide biosynthesis protein
MDLKEYLKIFKKNFKTFLIVVIIFIASGFVFQAFRAKNFKAALNINITRTGKETTLDYQFDNFYRFQADERFSDTVVRWLASPRIAADIYADAGINSSALSAFSLERAFKAQRLSSQFIETSFISKDAASAQKISKSIVNIINRETDKLNEQQQQANWFMAISDEPLIRPNAYGNGIVFIVSLLIGTLVGAWSVFIKHYFSK